MVRLALALYALVGTTIAGSAVLIALLMERTLLQEIGIAAGIGAAIAIPVSFLIAANLTRIAR
ncbi:MAG: CTP synthetase [Pseudomonadota bacterium]